MPFPRAIAFPRYVKARSLIKGIVGGCQLSSLKIAVETTELGVHLGILAEWCGRSDCLIRIGFELDHFIQRARFRRDRGAVRDWTAQQLEGLISTGLERYSFT